MNFKSEKKDICSRFREKSVYFFIYYFFPMKTFSLTTDYIELNKLMKLLKMTETGGQAKILISQWAVLVNGVQELQLRKKIRKGDVVNCDGIEVTIV